MIDIFLIVILLWAAFSGWRTGFIKELISAGGFIVGLLVAATCYKFFGEYLAVNGSQSNMVTSIVAFFILWIVVPIMLGLVANILTKALRGMQLGIPNSLLGALVSVVKYFLLLSCVFLAMEGLGIMNAERTASSHLYQPMMNTVHAIVPQDTTQVSPADEGEVKSDTVWVDVSKKKR